MALDEYLPAILIILGVYLFVRFLRRAPSNGDSIPGITASTLDTIHAAFPDVPLPNLIYSLSRTRSSQATSEEIIERGYLPAPPAGWQIPLSLQTPTVNPPSAPSSPITQLGKHSTPTKGVSLIERYGLSARIPSRKGKEVDPGEKPSVAGLGQDGTEAQVDAQAQGVKPKWEDTREGREKGLKERKERMILEARKRMLEREAKAAAAAAAES